MKEYITITDDDGVVRIDKFVSAHFSEYSRSALTKLFDLKLIKRDGVSLRPGEKVRPGTTIEYDLGPLKEKPEVIELPVLFEDENVIVINKPAGIISHARGRFWQEASVASFIRDKVTQSAAQIARDAESPYTADRAGIVHRLDRATSGVMLCAKNERTLSHIQKQFQARSVTKTYVAIVVGKMEHPSARIEAPLMRNVQDPKRFMVHPDGKQSTTDYMTLHESESYTTLELTPKTGRTHQLRLHLGYLGKTIVGDELYGGEEASRMMLHAHTITVYMLDGTPRTFEAPLPVEFEDYK